MNLKDVKSPDRDTRARRGLWCCEWWEKALNCGCGGGWNYSIMIRKLEPLLRESKQASLSVKGPYSARTRSRTPFFLFTDPPMASRAPLLFPEITEWIYGVAGVGVLVLALNSVCKEATDHNARPINVRFTSFCTIFTLFLRPVLLCFSGFFVFS